MVPEQIYLRETCSLIRKAIARTDAVMCPSFFLFLCSSYIFGIIFESIPHSCYINIELQNELPSLSVVSQLDPHKAGAPSTLQLVKILLIKENAANACRTIF